MSKHQRPDEPYEVPAQPYEYPDEPSEYPIEPDPYEPNYPEAPEPEPGYEK